MGEVWEGRMCPLALDVALSQRVVLGGWVQTRLEHPCLPAWHWVPCGVTVPYGKHSSDVC